MKDAQGGVIPGATVVLISEARGTRSTPAVTNTTGDFTFANVAADTYTVEVTMSGFKTLKRGGIVVSAGNRVAVGVLTIEVGGMQEIVDVKGESPVIQATTRRAILHGHDRLGREPADREPQLHRRWRRSRQA